MKKLLLAICFLLLAQTGYSDSANLVNSCYIPEIAAPIVLDYVRVTSKQGHESGASAVLEPADNMAIHVGQKYLMTNLGEPSNGEPDSFFSFVNNELSVPYINGSEFASHNVTLQLMSSNPLEFVVTRFTTITVDCFGDMAVNIQAGLQGDIGDIGPQGPQGEVGPAGPQGEAGVAGLGLMGPAGPQGETGATGPQGVAGATGPQGATGPAGESVSCCNKGPEGPAGVAGPTGPQGETGAIGPQGIQGETGATGPQGETGPIGPQGFQGETGATGPQGLAGTTGPQGGTGPAGPQGPQGNTGPAGAQGIQGIQGPAGAIAFAHFYALMPGDNAATVGAGTAVQFPQDGPLSGADISRINATQFNLAEIGVYEIYWQVSITEPGQLVLAINGGEVDYTVAGRATGTSQITNQVLVRTTSVNSILTIRNPVGNTPALTITPVAGGTHPVSATLIIKQIQ